MISIVFPLKWPFSQEAGGPQEDEQKKKKKIAHDWFQLILSLIYFVTMYLVNMDETL